MNLAEGILLGVVEGLTEFLPISSTGHLILTEHVMGRGADEFSKLYDVVIQSGAMLAVVVYYQKFFKGLVVGILKRQSLAFEQLRNLLIAFFPAMFFGALLHKTIKTYLFSPIWVAVALIVGGIIMLWFEKFHPSNNTQVNKITPKIALTIGMAQCAAMWPGMSRSMCTILGARSCGLPNWQAAEFSFLLAVPTLMAAAVYDLYKNAHLLNQLDQALPLLAVGTLTSFIVALGVIHFLLRFLKNHSLKIFAYYRIIFGIILLLFLKS